MMSYYEKEDLWKIDMILFSKTFSKCPWYALASWLTFKTYIPESPKIQTVHVAEEGFYDHDSCQNRFLQKKCQGSIYRNKYFMIWP